MSFETKEVSLAEVIEVTDYVANGSFAALKDNVQYLDDGFAILVRLVDHNANWQDEHIYVDESAYRFLAKSSLVQGDIIIANVGANAGTVFRVPKLSRPTTLGPNAVRVRPKVNSHLPVDRDFLYYYLSSSVGQNKLQSLITGSAQPKFNKTALRGLSLNFPDLPRQKLIASIMLAIDDRITLLRETNKTLESISQAIFKSWFVDFDPVRAKMEGRQPEGMDEATAALFPDSFEESDSGLIPKGWESKPFGELLSHTIGGDWGGEIADEKNNVRVAIIRGTDIPDLMSSAGSHVPIRYTSQKKLQSRKLQNGDIVLEVSGGSKGQPTGRSLYITNGLLEQFNCPVEPASFCRLLRPVSEGIGILLAQHMSYIYGKGKTWEYQNQSTGIANFQTTHFLKTELVAVPSSDVLGLFSNIVVPLTLRTRIMQIQELSRVRDALLPRLISGRLRLLDAASELESLCQ